MEAFHSAKLIPLRVRIWVDAIRANTAAQDLVEYAFMGGFVAVTCGALMPGVATNMSRIFSQVGSILFKSSGS